jgi:hypothetical protein
MAKIALLPGEKFKRIKDFPNYLISTHGRVISNSKYNNSGNKILNPKIRKGSRHVSTSLKGKTLCSLCIYELVANTFIPNERGYKKIIHIDGNRSNNRVSNLKFVKHEIELLPGEKFRRIKDLPNYLISTHGRVWSNCTNRKFEKRILKQQVLTCGYLAISFMVGGIRKTRTIHSLVATAFIPNTYSKKEVNHIDGNKLNNHVSNLEWNTGSENMIHAFNTGLYKKGFDHHLSKTTKHMLDEFLRMRSEGCTYQKIADTFNVSHTLVLRKIKSHQYQSGGLVVL